MMNKFFLLIALVLLSSCNRSKPPLSNKTDVDSIPTDSFEMEHMVVNACFDLPEVKKSGEEMINKYDADINADVAEYPHQNKRGYFHVRIWSTNSDLFPLPLFNFHVYFPSMEIYYLDTLKHQELSLGNWRESNGIK